MARTCFCRSYFQRKALRLPFPNMYSLVLGSIKSIDINLLDILACLELPCFSAIHFRVKFSSSRSIHLHCHNSPILNPVSFKAKTHFPTFLLQPAINASPLFPMERKARSFYSHSKVVPREFSIFQRNCHRR
jgi:hypothetical protein